MRAPAILLFAWLAAAIASAQQPATAGQAPTLQEAVTALHAQQPERALALFQQILAATPDDPTANLLAASTALELWQPALGVQYAEHARALRPDDWRVDTTLVTAYAMAGDKEKRDAVRARLRELHGSSSDPDAHEPSGFLLDRFRVGQYTVEAVEYFSPVTKDRIYFRFLLRPASDAHPAPVPTWRIDVESEPLNEASWRRAHPAETALGEAQFQIVGSSEAAREEYTSFSGKADYDDLKRRVTAIIKERGAAGFPSTSAKPQPFIPQ